ncbi:MAG: hypothetical protein ACI4RN_08415 [Oscillospiraceae bacterium]
MNVFHKVREWIRGMFSHKDIEEAYKIDTALTDNMINHIDLWELMYKGHANWVDNKEVLSLRLEQAIVREFSNVVTNEMTAKVSNKKLDNIFQKAIQDLNINLQHGLASGAMIIKPLGPNGTVQFVPQSEFTPIQYDATGRLIKVIFPEVKKVSDVEYLTRLEYHDLDPVKGLTITNRAFRSSTPDMLGKEIPLTAVPEWAELSPKDYYPAMFRPVFGYYVNPICNNIDGSFAGVSIYDCAKQLIRLADVQFGRLDWEFESGARRLNVDAQALAEMENGGVQMSKLYNGISIEDAYHEFSPALRQADFISGLDEYKRNIEFAVGLSYGDISNPQSIEKTATEIRSAKQRKYNTIYAIQKNLKACLDDLVYAIAFYNEMATQNYEFVCEFKDSILVDEETERTQDRQDVAMGAMPLWEYRAKWYGEDENTAKTMTTDSNSEVVE